METHPKNLRLIFEVPGETTLTEVIGDILKYNALEETEEEYFQKFTKGVESRRIIIKDAAIVIFEKKAPENKVIELLTTHLETTPEIAQKIVAEINQKLIPYAKEVPDDEEPKIAPAKPIAPAPKLPYSKKIEIPNVEENAEHHEVEKSESLQKARTVIPQSTEPKPQSSSADAYREPIE